MLLDNDGLLLDTESVWTRAERDLFGRRGAEFTAAHKRELVGSNAERAGATMARQLGEAIAPAELVAELDELVFAELERGVEPMPGARELVDRLRANGVSLGLVSNSPARFIARALELVEMSGLFGAVVSGHEVAAPKPAPDPYLVACELLGVEPTGEVVVLEDSPTGVESGLAAGLTVIGVPSVPGVELDGAHGVYDSLRAPGLLERLGCG